MTKQSRQNESKHSVWPYLVVGGASASGALSSFLLGRYLSKLGIRSGMHVNPDAIKAIDEFARATPLDVPRPDKFIYRYADLANKASSSRLFIEDPRSIAEWTVEAPKLNEAVIKAHGGLNRASNWIERLLNKAAPRLGEKYKNSVSRWFALSRGVLNEEFSPMGNWYNSGSTPAIRRQLRSHIPAMAESPMAALLRVMHEGAASPAAWDGVQIRRNLNRLKKKIGTIGKYVYDEKTGKLILDPRKGFSFAPGVKSVEDMRRIIDSDPILSMIAKNRSELYRGANFKHPVTLIRALQKLRSPKVQMVLGALGLGATGIGLWNYKKNKDYENSFMGRINNIVGSLKEKIIG